MSLQRVARASALRRLCLGDASPLQTRVTTIYSQLARLSLTSNSRPSTPVAGSIRSVHAGQRSQSYATEAKPTKDKKSTKKPARQLTEKQKEAKEKKESRELLKQLKTTALQPPKKLPQTSRAVATQSKLNELKTQSSSRSPVETFKEAVEQVTAQRLAEADRFIEQAEKNRAANEASYEAWLLQYTPIQIKQANTARKHLRRLGHKKYYGIHDERLVKAPLSPYLWFMKERHESGDFKHLAVKDASLRLSGEWKDLTDAEKKPYFDKAGRDQDRYREEYREVYGEDAPLPKAKSTNP
ncbi:hypothetical protein N7539_004234 [Penicillium diatomitis]|uniref:HMG box domain-containing protein n=1 Tax=Penicillium diatomitis TaxID=2819901 RepID=A0A9X0BYA6_9EURO|nr:uncharacterized protein N7539_004234 [Penicillium diatomitis]KAJ5489344.1 hypothetical protein N7539_004234 [Penicillium diatomitis]